MRHDWRNAKLSSNDFLAKRKLPDSKYASPMLFMAMKIDFIVRLEGNDLLQVGNPLLILATLHIVVAYVIIELQKISILFAVISEEQIDRLLEGRNCLSILLQPYMGQGESLAVIRSVQN